MPPGGLQSLQLANTGLRKLRALKALGLMNATDITKTFMHDQERPEMVLNSPLNLRLCKQKAKAKAKL